MMVEIIPLKDRRYIPVCGVLENSRKLSGVVLRDKITGKFVSLRFGEYSNKQWKRLQDEISLSKDGK